jgi:hypothetical protein
MSTSTETGRIALTPSWLLRLAAACFVAGGVASVATVAMPRLGAAPGVAGAVAVGIALAIVCVFTERKRPRAIEVRLDGIRVWPARLGHPDAAAALDAPVARLAGYAQFGAWLLVFRVAAGEASQASAWARDRTVLVAADMVSAEAFRALALWGRRRARHR